MIDSKSPLHPTNVTSFPYCERLVPCRDIYSDGVLPGMSYSNDDEHNPCQQTRIERFDNFIEWSKIVVDETIRKGDRRLLLTSFFDNRAQGWKEKYFVKKPGHVIGYYLDGKTFSPSNPRLGELFATIYHDLIRENENYLKLFPLETPIEFSEDLKVILKREKEEKAEKEEKEAQESLSGKLFQDLHLFSPFEAALRRDFGFSFGKLLNQRLLKKE
jgi:hypothetical protein